VLKALSGYSTETEPVQEWAKGGGCKVSSTHTPSFLELRSDVVDREYNEEVPNLGIPMAEGVGFEPTVQLPVRLISSQVPSTNSATLPFVLKSGTGR
jgi:hypothetical protein